MKPLALILLVLFSFSRGLQAQSDLRETLKDNVGGHWIYDDFKHAQARAKETGQPLLVLFRCVP